MFKIGEYVIYKRNLCIIKDIIDNKYYKLAIIDDDTLTIMVPIDNKFALLRYPITINEANNLITNINSIPPLNLTEKILENTYKDLMKTNKHEDLIKIIKTTYLRNKERLDNGKKIGDKDQIYFEQAEKYLYNELSYVFNMSYEDCRNYIINCVTTIEGDKFD